jgi:Fe-S cluster assembly scaffold protein SufB
MQKIVFKKDKTLEINKSVSNLSVVVRPGVSANLVLKGLVRDIKVKVENRADFHLINLVNVVNKSDSQAVIELVGIRAKARVSGLFHGISDNNHAFNVVLHHKTSNTKGDILIKGVYEDKAKGFFSGLIKIDPKAVGTNSYFTNNNLLLDDASVVSVPKLEIGTDDVKVSHGSTTGRMNEEQLYYLMSRGLSRKVARCMIIEGFLQPVIKQLPK